jgi:hypothetical protein
MILQVVLDRECAGFYIIKRKSSIQICLGYLAIRFFNVTESKYFKVIHKAIEIEKKKGAFK